MRANLLFVGLLAAGVTALPKADPVSSAPSSTESDSDIALPDKGSADESNASETPLPTECKLSFETQEEGEDAWEDSGAGDFLSDYLDDNGLEGWANDFLKDTVSGGLGGATFDCENIEETSSCNLPGERSCGTYDPPEAYYVHISLANLNSMFHVLYLSLMEREQDELVSKAADIEEIYGEPETEGIYPLMIGAFVMGAAMAGPFWIGGATLTGFVGVLNVAAGMAEQADDVTESLEKTIKGTFTNIRDSLKKTAEAISSGDFDDLDDVDDTTEFILDAFKDGQMMVVDEKNEKKDDYLESFTKYLNAVLIFQCLNSNDWYIQIYDDVDEDDCKDETDGTGYWLRTPDDDEKRCAALVYVDEQTGNPNNPNTRTHLEFLDDDQWEAFKEFEVDIEQALQNMLDCDGGDFKLPDAKDIDSDGKYPSCLFPMKIEGKGAAPQDLEEGTQSCEATDRGVYATWSVEISCDYDSAACNDLYDAIKDHGSGLYKTPTNWQCEEQDGQFQIWFDLAKDFGGDGAGKIINGAFGDVFPSEDGKYCNINGFNCPDS